MEEDVKLKGRIANELAEMRRRVAELESLEAEYKKSITQLSKKTRYEEIASVVTRSVHQSINLQEVLENAVDTMSKNIDVVGHVAIYLVEGEAAVMKAHRGHPDWFVERVGRIPYPKGFTWKTIIEGKPLYCPDVDQDTVIGPAGREVGTKSYAAMPVRFEGKAVGSINIHSFKKNAFDVEDLKLLEIVARQIETAISNAKQAEELLKAKEELELRVEERTKELAAVNEELKKEIAERKQAEEKLRESEGRFRIMADSSPALIWVNGPDGCEFVNRGYLEFLGVSDTDVRGYDWAQFIHPEDRDDYLNAYMLAMNQRGLFEAECRLRRHDGEYRWMRSVGQPRMGPNREFLGYAGLTFDITEHNRAEEELKKSKDELERLVQERTASVLEANQALRAEIMERKAVEGALRESEERYRTLVENAPEAIVVLDVETGRFTDVNENAARLFKLTREDMLSFGPVDLSPPTQPDGRLSSESALEKIREAINGRAPKFEWTHRDADGKSFLCEVSLVKLPSGKRTLVRGSVMDITDRKRAEEERLRLDKLESLGILAGGIAHDFNNLLTSILVTVSSTKMKTRPGTDAHENLTDVEGVCLQAKRLAQQLLTFSRGGAPVKKLTSIRKVVEDSTRFVLRGSGVKCDLNVAKNLWDVEADEGQISQVINNLIINADQAMPQGGEIRVSAEDVNAEAESSLPLLKGKYVKITIEDKGIGIPKEHLSKIFDPYFSTKQKGSGLGLATVYSIIKGHNGYIEVESELGVGTKFQIYLPASAERLEKKRATKKTGAHGRKPYKKKKILLMDDEALVRLAAGKALANLGYDVEYARDGSEAIEIYKSAMENGKSFDAVIMDLTIPGGMGGREAIKKLIDIDSEVKAIVSSGYSNDPVMSQFRDYGFKGVVAKPYEAEELAEAINKVIGGV